MGCYTDNPDAIAALVRGREVHRDVYIDPEIYRLEMKHLFANSWVFVGHDSQTPNKGDYFTTQIGDQPVIQVRHSDGEIHVLYNRCPHKGTKIAIDRTGNTGKFFRCPYHAWSFKTDGCLLAIPLKKGYENTGFEQAEGSKGMRAVGAVKNYRGFIFGPPCRGRDQFRGLFRRLAVLARQHGRPLAPARTARGCRSAAALHAQVQLEDAGRKPDRHLPSDGGA